MQRFLLTLLTSSLLLLTSNAKEIEASSPSPSAPEKTSEDEVYNLRDLDQKPEPKRPQAPPVYPFDLKRKEIQGKAMVQFVIDTKGKVRDVEIIEASHAAFGRAAVDAVSQWKFTPGIKDGKPVNTRMRIPVNFNLNSKR
jgi:TonB family protein